MQFKRKTNKQPDTLYFVKKMQLFFKVTFSKFVVAMNPLLHFFFNFLKHFTLLHLLFPDNKK